MRVGEERRARVGERRVWMIKRGKVLVKEKGGWWREEGACREERGCG